MSEPLAPRRVASVAAAVVATLLAALLLWEVRTTVGLLLLALATANAAQPLVHGLTTRLRLPRALSLAITYALGLAALGALGYIVGLEVVAELERGTDQFFAGYERQTAAWRGRDGMLGMLANRLPPAAEVYRTLGRSNLGAIAEGAVDTTLGVLDVLGHGVVVIALALYWAIHREQVLRAGLLLLPPERRAPAFELWKATFAAVGAQLRGALAQGVLTLLLCGLLFRAIGLDYWALPATVVAIANLFPLIGVLFGGLAAALAGGLESPAHAALAAGGALAVTLFLSQVVLRRVLRTRPTSPLLAVLTAMLLAGRYGLVALLAAPLVAAAVQPVLESLVASRAALPSELDRLVALDERVQKLRRQLVGATDAAPELTMLVARLESLLVAARQREEGTVEG